MPPKSESIHDPLQSPIQGQLNPGPEWDAMTDEEVLAFLARETDEDKYAVQHLAPDGMAYQWVRCEVFGKPDTSRTAEVEQRGWRAVPNSRHSGRWAPAGTQGPIIQDGLMLYEIPDRVKRLKRELSAKVARDKVEDMNAQLAYSPPGTGPRVNHRPGKPMVERRAAATEMQLVVE